MLVEAEEMIPTVMYGSHDAETIACFAAAHSLSDLVMMTLINLCTCNEGFLSLISKTMLQSVDLLHMLLKLEKFFAEDVVEKLQKLLLKLIAEPLFRYEFAKIYVQHYPNVIQEAINIRADVADEEYPIGISFSVQLFTVRTLTHQLVREMNLLGVLLGCLETILTSCIVKNRRLKASKWYKLVGTFTRVIDDICFCLSHNEVRQYVLEEQDVFRRWLSLLGLVQGTDPQKRITADSHVKQEALNSFKPFYFEMLFRSVNKLLMEGDLSVVYLVSDLGTEMLKESDLPKYMELGRFSLQSSSSHSIPPCKFKGKQSVGSQSTLPTIAWLISECFGIIEKSDAIKSSSVTNLYPKGIQYVEEYGFRGNKNLEEIWWPRISYDVSSQEISFYIPLHRFLSLLLHTAIAHASGSHIFFNMVLGNYHHHVFSSFLMEHPLQLRVFCAQVSALMWARNGDMSIGTMQSYHDTHWLTLDEDLFLLQCSAALAPADLFLSRIAERFGLLDYLLLKPSTYNENEVVLMKEMLILIIQLVKERRYCGLSPTENLQREIVHKLAVEDAPLSRLVYSLPSDLALDERDIQEVIDAVAVYMKPSTVKQGSYSLRQSYWKDLDLYFPGWNARESQVAEERYLHMCKVSPLCIQLPRWSKIYSPLSMLSRIATSKSIIQIVRSVLFYAASTDMAFPCRELDGVFISALHLLSLALDVCEKQKNGGNFCNISGTLNDTSQLHAAASFPTETIPVLEFATETICANVVKESGISSQQSLISLLVLLMNKHKNEHMDADSKLRNTFFLIRDLLMKFSQLDAVCMKELKQLAPDFVFEMPEDSSSNSTQLPCTQPSSKSQILKLKAREKQAAILEKMKAEQSKFAAANFQHTENDNLEQALEESSPVCSLCHDRDSKRPLSFLVLLQKSRLSSFMSRDPPSWKEIDILADMEINAASSSSAARTENAHDLHHPGDDAFTVTSVNQHPFKTLCSSTSMEKDIRSSIEIIEKDIYQKYASSLCTEGLKSGKNKISLSTDFGECAAQYSLESSYKHAQYSPHVENPSPVSTIPFLTDCDGIHVSSCGHAMHLECYTSYIHSLTQRYSRRPGLHCIFDPEQGELLCPVCRRFNNSILPVISKDLAASKSWNPETSLYSHPTSDSGTLFFSDTNHNVSHFRDAVSLLWSIAEVVKTNYSPASILKSDPRMTNEALKTNLQPIIQKLLQLYFNDRHGKKTISKMTHSMMLLDTLRYSLISTEIANRGRGDSGFSLTSETLEREIHSSTGAVLAELLRVAHLSRSSDVINLLVRFRGCQFFADSICANVLGELDIPHFSWRQDSVPLIQEERPFSEKFWTFASDPVLSHEAFSSLMWVLFSLPAPFMLSMEVFDSLIRLFYVVCMVQALITCQGMHSCDHSDFINSRLYDICKILGDSDLGRQYFVTNHVDGSCSPKDMIRKLTLPYLRRCALLKELLKSSQSASDTKGSELETMFRICQLDVIFNDEFVQNMALRWCQHFLQAFTGKKFGTVLHMSTVVPFRLVQLPDLYHELLERYHKRQCPKCGDVNKSPALCLLCGRLCSHGYRRCCRANSYKAHAVACGAGIGVFLLVEDITNLLLRSRRVALWPSLYLDAFGEEFDDISSQRQFFLSKERYLKLTDLVASHGFDHSSEVLGLTDGYDIDLD